jgi:hypothetical protein
MLSSEVTGYEYSCAAQQSQFLAQADEVQPPKAAVEFHCDTVVIAQREPGWLGRGCTWALNERVETPRVGLPLAAGQVGV